MTHTITRIGFASTVKIAASLGIGGGAAGGAVAAAQQLLQFWDVFVRPDVLAPLLAQMALLGACAGGISTALTVLIYICARPSSAALRCT